MDKLYESVKSRGHVCIGLDTAVDYLPSSAAFATAGASATPEAAKAIFDFNKAIIDASLDIAACFKVQIAYYEELGLAGLECYAKTLEYIRKKGALVIADIKRGDIADTAERYARAHFDGDFEADFVTLTPFLGMDSIEPWLEWADKKGKGAFVLMRTSNKGRKDFQLQKIAVRKTQREPAGPQEPGDSIVLSDVIGEKLSGLAAAKCGVHGYGAFGAVVGIDTSSAEERNEAIAIRARYPNLFFLIPGYGAQGGAADDVALLLNKGNGGVVNASRSILKAWQSGASGGADNDFAAKAAREAAINMRDAIRKAIS